MLRPGRFDLIIPIGAPDSAGRAELAAEFLEQCDPEDIAERTEGFTPADFALAAQRAAQLAFERALAGGAPAVTSDDCADACRGRVPASTRKRPPPSTRKRLPSPGSEAISGNN